MQRCGVRSNSLAVKTPGKKDERRGGVVDRTEIGSHPLGCTDKKGATQSSHLHLVVGCTGPEAASPDSVAFISQSALHGRPLTRRSESADNLVHGFIYP
jgi:hypothetical protein